MRRRGLAVAVTLFMLAGCGKETSDERVIEIAVKVEKQQQAIDRLTAMIEGIDKRLEEIEKSPEGVTVPSSPPQVTSTDLPETPAKTTRNLSSILEQLNLSPNLLAEAQETIQDYAERVMQSAAAWRAMGGSEELSQRLDLLVENFSARVGNPTLVEKLAGDVEWLKNRFLAQLTPEQQRELARTMTVEAIRMMSHEEQSRQWLETQLRALDEATNPLEVNARVNVTLELWKTWQVRELARTHNIPAEMMEESGLTLSPEAATFIPAEMMEGLGLAQSP